MSSVEVLKKRKMSSSNSPCAACKCLRRKCTLECVFAPYFPPDNPRKFTNVHKVFGASNVSKILNELSAAEREDAVNSLAYEAEYRLRDPVYGCVGLISYLQHKLKQVQHDLEDAKKELATYIGPGGLVPVINQSGYMPQQSNFGPSSAGAAFQMMSYNMQPLVGVQHGPQLVLRYPQPQQQQQHHQFLEAQQLAAAAREQEILRSYDQQQQNGLGRFNGGFDDSGGSVTVTGFNQMPAGAGAATIQPSLALGTTYETAPYHHHIQLHANVAELHLQPQAEFLLQQHQSVTAHHQTQPQLVELPRAKSEEGRSVGPSC